ncbi:unnamed protein product [Linum tenue]|uniref:Leucine-rich repeat-containing N-terminal plant-type domain-containing protein n=1 Tax=Linum tenue TaxID=586396 RepID=A0AAV0MDH0_9ROSI|nr:unnamed protein product [Linum tenue]
MQPRGCCRGILTTNFMLLLHHHLLLNNANAVVASSSGDGRALLEFKSGISVDTTGILSTWLPTTNHCTDWEGVVCDPAEAIRVTSLLLQVPPEGYMKGTLSPSLGSLTSLENLVITRTKHIAWNIPGTISNLTRLNQLIIEDFSIAGLILPSIGSFRCLASVSLARNRLNSSIPPSLWTLPSLQLLSLSQNSLSGTISTARSSGRIPTTFPNITFLDLSYIVSQAGSRRLCSPYRVSETSH